MCLNDGFARLIVLRISTIPRSFYLLRICISSCFCVPLLILVTRRNKYAVTAKLYGRIVLHLLLLLLSLVPYLLSQMVFYSIQEYKLHATTVGKKGIQRVEEKDSVI